MEDVEQAVELLRSQPEAWLSFDEPTRAEIKLLSKPIYMVGAIVPYGVDYNAGPAKWEHHGVVFSPTMG